MRMIRLSLALVVLVIGMPLNVHAENIKYYRFVGEDINGNMIADYPLKDPTGYKVYFQVFSDAQGRIEKYKGYWQGKFYGTVYFYYNGDDTRIQKAKFDMRKYSGIVKLKDTLKTGASLKPLAIYRMEEYLPGIRKEWSCI